MKTNQNLRIYPFFEIFLRFSPHFLVAPLYYQDILGSYALAMAVFSVTLVSSSILEIPTGILSDFIGRRKTIMLAALSSFLGFFSFIISGCVSAYAAVYCFGGAVLMGLTQALYSGTLDALIYESVKECGRLKSYNQHYIRGNGFGSAASAVSALISGVIAYYFGYLACFVLSGLSAFITLMISFFYIDPSFQNEKITKNGFEHFTEAFKDIWSNPKLCLTGLAKILGDNVSYRIDIIYFRTLIPEYLLGTPRMLKKIFESLSFLFAFYFIKKFTLLKILIISNTWMISVRAIAVCVNNFLSPFIISMVDLLDGTSSTAFSNLLQTEYADNRRATIASIISMFSTIWTSLLLVVIGYVIDYAGIRTALIIMITYRFIRFYIYHRLQKMSAKD